MSKAHAPLILVDGSSYLYRAFHALPALSNSKGVPTGAIYGMINMLRRLINDYHPTHMAVIFDPRGKTTRDEIYPAYKATRKAMPNELAQQIEPIFTFIRAMGLPLIQIEGIEADDVIGTIAHQACALNMNVLISTGDKDLAQLVNANITLINTMTQSILNPTGVKEKFGVPPERIIDYLTLVGDSADNIPGVPGVGPKTAVKWLEQYHSLEGIVAHAADIKGKVGEHLRATLPQLALTQSLVTINQSLSVAFNFADFKIGTQDSNSLINLYKEFEFKTLLADTLKTSDTEQAHHAQYTIIQDEATLKHWLDAIQTAQCMIFDSETTSLDYMQAKLVGISLALESGRAAYIPFGHDTEQAPKQLAADTVLAAMKPLFENPHIKKIGQNLKYDSEVLAHHDITLQGISHDTMLESYVLDSASRHHDLSSLALKYLGLRTIEFSEIAGKGKNSLSFNQIALNKAAPYAAEDADVTLRLHQTLWPRIESIPSLLKVFEEIEMPLVSVLAKIERTGVLIDATKLKAQGKKLATRLAQLKEEIVHLAGQDFNLNSPKQLQEILFEKLNLPILEKTPSGQASTADSVLQELAYSYELPRLIIEYRSISKLISTYTSRLVEQINPHTGRLHTSYNQTGTATGRLSSSNPNLQNIPVRTEEGRRIRQAFIAKKGYQLISADYSQIELRIMAHISQDQNLLKAFHENKDIHQATAAEVWEVPLDQVTPTMRRDAKAINFGLIYGMSAFGLTRQLGIERKAAQEYIDRYFLRYPGVKQYMEQTRAKAYEQGYVETLWGRRLFLADIRASQMMRRKAAERTAINAPLQGSAADIIKLAMIKIDHYFMEHQIDAAMIMQVHDELVFEVATETVSALIPIIRSLMTEVVQISIPMLVAIQAGDNWDAASGH